MTMTGDDDMLELDDVLDEWAWLEYGLEVEDQIVYWASMDI